MQEFTPMDYFWILLTIALICTIIGIIFRSVLRVALTIALLFLIASIGFGFIPEQIGRIQNGETTSGEVINELGNSIGNKVEEGVQYIEDNKESIVDSFMSTWNKVACSISNSCNQDESRE